MTAQHSARSPSQTTSGMSQSASEMKSFRSHQGSQLSIKSHCGSQAQSKTNCGMTGAQRQGSRMQMQCQAHFSSSSTRMGSQPCCGKRAMSRGSSAQEPTAGPRRIRAQPSSIKPWAQWYQLRSSCSLNTLRCDGEVGCKWLEEDNSNYR